MDSSAPTPTKPFRVGDWHVDPGAHALLREGDETRVEPKVMALLVALASRPGRTLSREDLMATVWPDVIVSDDSLSRAVSKLRAALGDDQQEPRYVETIPRAGYRLLAPVAIIEATSPPPAAPASPARPARLAMLAGAALLAVLLLAVVVLAVGGDAEAPTAQTLTHLPGLERHPALSPDGQRIAFVAAPRGSDAQADLYVQDVGGATPLRLTTSAENERHPVWLTDGRLAFLRCSPDACAVYTVSASGGGARRAVDEPVGPWGLAASPTGLAVVASIRQNEGPYQLVRLDLGTGERTVLSRPPSGTTGDLTPALSPDGAHVAFVRHGAGGDEDVWVLRLGSGGEPRRLTSDGVPLRGIAWTGEGDALVYAAAREGLDALWTVPVRGGDPSRVATGGVGVPQNPSILGDRLVYEAHTSDVNIYSADSTGHWRPAIVGTGIDDQPTVHPDGDRLAFISSRTGSNELWTASIDGSDLVQLTSFGGVRLGAPRWSPDGQTLVFEVQKDGEGRLYRIAATGGQPTVLTGGAYDIGPRWSQDGRALYFGSNRGGEDALWRANPDGSGLERLAPGFVGEPTLDGRGLLYVAMSTFGIHRLTGDRSTSIDTTLNYRDWGSWVVTTRGVLMLDRSGGTTRLVRLQPESGRREVLDPDLGFIPMRAPALDATPDGRRIVLARVDRTESAIVLVEPLGR